MGFGYWAVTEKASGLYLGDVGFLQRDAPTHAKNGVMPEMGWAIDPEAQGQGIAIEAAAAAIKWLEDTDRFNATVCDIDEANTRSLILAQKLGFEKLTCGGDITHELQMHRGK
jgi:RimJ/RimL family protein N-acetyltransferase